MAEIQPGNSTPFWPGVVSGVLITLITTFLAFSYQGIVSSIDSGPLKVSIIQTEIDIGFSSPKLYNFQLDNIADALLYIQGLAPPKNALAVKGVEYFTSNKDKIVQDLKLAANPPYSLKIIRLENTGKKVLQNIKVKSDVPARIVGPQDDHKKTNLVSGDIFSITAIDPGEAINVFVWLDGIRVSKYAVGLKILLADEVVGYELVPTDISSTAELIAARFGGFSFVVAIVMFVGVAFCVLMPIAAVVHSNPTLRRRFMTKEEFEKILSDVEVLYPVHRPNSQNPFSPSSQK